MNTINKITISFSENMGMHVTKHDISSDIISVAMSTEERSEKRGRSPLDRSTPHTVDSIDEFLLRGYDSKLYLRQYGSIGLHEVPYALTFTFPAPGDRLFASDKPLRIYNKYFLNRNIYEQMNYFKNQFEIWLAKVKRALKVMQTNVEIPCYEVYAELTQQGVLHAHALMYVNNNYSQAVREIMMEQWRKINPGVYKISMKKKKGSGTDYAFDRCNKVDTWRKYITKEQPEWYPIPVVLPSSLIPMMYNIIDDIS